MTTSGDHKDNYPPLTVSKNQRSVLIQTIGHRIQGNIHLRENERIKDAFNTSELFIAVTGAKIFNADGSQLEKRTDFLALNRQHVVWAIEEDSNEENSTRGKQVPAG